MDRGVGCLQNNGRKGLKFLLETNYIYSWTTKNHQIKKMYILGDTKLLIPKTYVSNTFTRFYGHITLPPHSTIKEIPLTIVYDANVMPLMEIDMPILLRANLINGDDIELRCTTDLINEIREIACGPKGNGRWQPLT